jgi:SsrA-binding protein
MPKQGNAPTIENRQARHKFSLLETYEAGLVLSGCEVKSIRQGKASLSEAYGHIEGNEVWLEGMYIHPYEQGGRMNPKEPAGRRKLLLHSGEIRKLKVAVGEKGLTLVPVKLYFNSRGFAKITIAVARGKKLYDRRDEIIKRDQEKSLRRVGSHRHEKD